MKSFILEQAQLKQTHSCVDTDDSGNASDIGSVVTICKESETDKVDTISISVTSINMDSDRFIVSTEESLSNHFNEIYDKQ